MPHLQEKNDTKEITQSLDGTASLQNSEDLPIKEAEKGSLPVTSALLSIAEAAKLSLERESSVDEEPTSEDADDSSPSANLGKQAITPSPFGAAAHGSPRSKHGPMLSIYGSKKLFTSPIRVKKRVSLDDEDDKSTEDSPERKELGQPKNLRYGRKHVLPMANQANSSPKRQADESETNSPTKKARTQTPESEGKGAIDESSPDLNGAGKKKPIISPASSEEKDNESTGTPARGFAYSYHGRHYAPYHHPHMPHYPPPHHAYPSPYGPGYPMYSGYPPTPSHHYMATPPGAHPGHYYPYPPHHPNMMSPCRPPHSSNVAASPPRGFSPLGMTPMTKKEKSSISTKGDQSPKTVARVSPSSVVSETPKSTISSVADWQRSAVSNGKPPSANRCVPLTEPIPSKFWGESDKTKDAVLPDFHRLVNFPDYLAKARNSGDATRDGKKHCVMCGKLRFCSVSSLVNKSRTPKQDATECKDQDEEDAAAHIIPRQNKGLCTACDVTVWVVADDGLEIKWCKGCKNFRPWAAFGDKGSATKCVRCRDRQREKYAMQKDEIRQRRYKQTSKSEMRWEDPAAKEKHLAAANGLRNLIHAATSS